MRKALIVATLLLAAVPVLAVAPPETIVSIERPKHGKDAELLAAIREAHAVYERLNAVTGPFTLYRGSDELGGAYFIEIFTWRSADIPDNAPPEIRAAWAKLESLVEKRNGRPGIEFYAVEPLTAESSPRGAAPSK